MLVAESDEDDLVNCLNKLIDDPDLRASLANNSRVAAKQLTWENQENLLVDIYKKSIINGNLKTA
ncbi:D-inositol-3-phosphate glycosyltransferase [compost metagenome]